MSKRRISKQQSVRIQKLQANYRLPSNQVSSLCEKGLVMTRFGRQAEVEDQEGNRIQCSIRANIDSLVAGDQVVWQTSENGYGVIVSRYPRLSVLCRPDKRGDIKPVAANISQLMIVVAPKPSLTWPLLDSYLVMAEYLQLQAVIVLNKTDLPCETLKNELMTYYQTIGYPLLCTSKKDLFGYDTLQNALNNHTSVFVGQSGVGKSSLIAGILPLESINTASISSQSDLGCHTTSNSRLYHLPKGGALIDSPGVREFGLCQMSSADIVYGFREFRDLVTHCKFRNCNHRNSPDCALLNAMEKGQISSRRYESFIKITTQLANDY